MIQGAAQSEETAASTTPEKVICIDDANIDMATNEFPGGVIVKGNVYHVTAAGVFDNFGTPAFRLLGFPCIDNETKVEKGWRKVRFKKLR